MPDKKHKTALVLGGGGALGLAHIGVIKVLEENYIPIDMIAGTSIGALIGGLYASGMKTNEMEKVVKGMDKLMLAKIFVPKLFSSGIINNKHVIDFIKNLTGQIRIENLNIPFVAVATDLITGDEIDINHGPLADAIMASIAIPAIFQPVMLESQLLVDGGLSNPLPISTVTKMKAGKIIAVNVSPDPVRMQRNAKSTKSDNIKTRQKKLPGMISHFIHETKDNRESPEGGENETVDKHAYIPSLMSVFMRTIYISINNLIEAQLKSAKPDILICPKIEDYDMFEFYKGLELIEKGYSEANRLLPEIKACIAKKKYLFW